MIKRFLGLALSVSLLTGCLFENDKKASQEPVKLAMDTNKVLAIAASSPDFSTTDVLILKSSGNGDFELEQDQRSTTEHADISISAHDAAIFRLNRFGSNSITRFDVAANGQVNLAWEYSVLAEGDSSANPYSMVVDSSGQGYVARYDLDDLWVVNPAATTQGSFLVEAIDLSAYAYEDGQRPRMSSLVIHNGRLYVLIERLHVDGWTYEPRASSRVLSIDLDDFSDIAEVDVEVRNANSLRLLGNKLYVLGRGNTSNTGTVGKCEGGIVSIDTANNNAVEVLMTDCNDEEEYRFGRLTGMTVVDANNGYFIGSAGWGDDTLYHFNPSAVDVAASVTAVAETGGRGLGGLLHVANTQAGNSSDLVFVGRSAKGDNSAEIMVIDVAESSATVAQRIPTTFNPGGMALVQLP